MWGAVQVPASVSETSNASFRQYFGWYEHTAWSNAPVDFTISQESMSCTLADLESYVAARYNYYIPSTSSTPPPEPTPLSELCPFAPRRQQEV